jgi:TolB-like protein
MIEQKRVSGAPIVIGILVFSGIIVAICASWLFSRPKSAPAPPPSLALLFVDATPTQIGQGMATQITATLDRVPGYYVAPRSAVEARKSEEDAAKIGRELNVRDVLECGLTPMEDHVHVHIKARLINTSDGFEMWTQTYDPDAKDASSVAGEIASGVAKTLQLQVPQS